MSKSKGAYVYEDPKTGELYRYSRRGVYKKNGRTLVFVKKTKGDTVTRDFIKEADEFLQDKKNKADDKEYGIRLYDLNIKWQVDGQLCLVLSIEQEQ